MEFTHSVPSRSSQKQSGECRTMPSAIEVPPHSPVMPVTETLHGVAITDPYRWLEDQESPETRSWLMAQATYCRTYLDALPGRDRVHTDVGNLLTLKEVPSEPWNAGDRYYFLKRQKSDEQPRIVMRKGLFGEETVLVDPAARKAAVPPALAIAALSRNGRFLGYSVRTNGADYSALEILDLERGTVLPDRISEGHCMGIAFSSDDSGFYYAHRKPAKELCNPTAVRWHRFGTGQQEDPVVFSVGEESLSYLAISSSSQPDTFAYVVALSGKQRLTSLYLHRAHSGVAPELLLRDIEGCFIPFFSGDQLLAYTDHLAPNFRIVCIDPTSPHPSGWREVVSESDQRIQQFSTAGNQVFVTRVHGFSTQVEAFSLDGTCAESIALPPRGTVDLSRASASDKLFFSYSSISEPATVFCYDTRTKQLAEWEKSCSALDPSSFASEEVTYLSKDGTSIPLFLAAKKELLHSGPLPTFLTSYGGFGICVTPRFTAFATFLIEQGFLFAVPAIRGGSELGEKWHSNAMRTQRQKSFDDFITAAEWLIAVNRSSRSQIAIGGGSNAGLLVGAAVTQRPDLFRAAICLGPLLDMTRYHLFDEAARWSDEYGSPEDSQDFQSLLAYSPYHNVRQGTPYPAVLLISGDADTRCNPMHARKMTARLQAASSSGHPVLLQYKHDWGHTPTQPLSAKADALTDRLLFVCHELGVAVERGRF